jgi:Beta-galactosidase trimerisation domain
LGFASCAMSKGKGCRLLASAFGIALSWTCASHRSLGQAGLPAEEVPTFRLRARVLSVARQPPTGKEFVFRYSVPSAAARATGDGWSDWLIFGRPEVEATLRTYPNVYLRRFPAVVILRVQGLVDPTQVEMELRLDEDGSATNLRAELFGPSLGILLWRDESKKPHAGTMADYNQRYWTVLADYAIAPSERPRTFPIADRFIGGDDDRWNWREGIEHLARAGLNVLTLPPSSPVRELLLQAGLHRTGGGVYNPPGYAFDFGVPGTPAATPGAIDAWAQKLARSYLDAGYARNDVALFKISDEPGWYYPSVFQSLISSPAALARFRDYLRDQKLEPADVGAKTWGDMLPIGRSAAKDLPSRRLFYWTMRFFAWDSSRHFARCTQALEATFYPNVPVLTNWNFFSGRSYVPGPVAHNPDKMSPDAAMGAHDWLEFGKLRGCTMLWTEDWFPDSKAYQWSFYCTKLRCAAAKSGAQFGGYIVPRAAGDREDGILQKALCLAGSGGKAILYYVFGPEYNFPGNCYSERAPLLRKIAEANRLIGRAEDLLWAGQRPPGQVAILMPRSAQVWDAQGVPLPTQIRDATNSNLNAATVDYLAEVADLYLALQHLNIPVDFVDEEDLSPEGLQPYRVLYVTAPDIPEEEQRDIAAWVRSGGTLVTVTGAGAGGRYDEPCRVLADFTGFTEQPRERLLVPSLDRLAAAGQGQGTLGAFTAVGARGTLVRPPGRVEATFEDGSPAIVQRPLAKGRVVHFAWMPGLSYAKSAGGVKDRLPAGFSEAIRRWILYPIQLAGVQAPVTVDRAMVETPLLLSSGGAAVTLLNWTGEPLARVSVSARVPFTVRRVESMQGGPLPFHQSPDDVAFSLPLAAADIVTLRP